MKGLFVLTGLMVFFFLAAPNEIEAQKRKPISRDLSRALAKQLILKILPLPKDETVSVPLRSKETNRYEALSNGAKYLPPKKGVMLRMEQEGFLNYVVEEESSSLIDHTWWRDGAGFGGLPLSDNDPRSVELRQSGYVHKFYFSGTYHHVGTLTEKGKAYLVGGNLFKLGKIEFGAITGIAEGLSPSIAEAEYYTVFTPTLFGIAVYGAKRSMSVGRATFRRYDDGWRIVR